MAHHETAACEDGTCPMCGPDARVTPKGYKDLYRIQDSCPACNNLGTRHTVECLAAREPPAKQEFFAPETSDPVERHNEWSGRQNGAPYAVAPELPAPDLGDVKAEQTSALLGWLVAADTTVALAQAAALARGSKGLPKYAEALAARRPAVAAELDRRIPRAGVCLAYGRDIEAPPHLWADGRCTYCGAYR